ncbi:nuclear transport factor 2 family protein [Nocardioides sp. NPDC101246]|uniref:nuclear transport factor 2 family protein n=1 Tax=Nocardioides sp. NPDC101246 TaxID=3364336 RepID=UPI0037FDE0D7
MSTTATPSKTVEAFLNAFTLKDVDGAMSTVAGDANVTVFPLKVRDGGPQVIRQFLDDVVRAFPDLLITVKSVIEVGNVVVAEFKIEGTQSADFLDAINQEKHLDLDTAWRFTVAGDQIVGLDAYWCQNQLHRRLAVKRQDHVTIV